MVAPNRWGVLLLLTYCSFHKIGISEQPVELLVNWTPPPLVGISCHGGHDILARAASQKISYRSFGTRLFTKLLDGILGKSCLIPQLLTIWLASKFLTNLHASFSSAIPPDIFVFWGMVRGSKYFLGYGPQKQENVKSEWETKDNSDQDHHHNWRRRQQQT